MKINWNVPNILTLIRLCLTPVVVVLFLLNIPNGIGVFVALGVYVLGCFTDFLDGHIARKYNLITDFGKFMDQIADKALTTTAIILVLLATSVAPVWLSVVMVLIVVLRDTVISGVRMVAANHGVVIAADIFGKIKSFFLDIASMVLMLYVGLVACLPGAEDALIGKMPLEYVRLFGIALMVMGIVLTLISLVNYLVKAFKSFAQIENEKEREELKK